MSKCSGPPTHGPCTFPPQHSLRPLGTEQALGGTEHLLPAGGSIGLGVRFSTTSNPAPVERSGRGESPEAALGPELQADTPHLHVPLLHGGQRAQVLTPPGVPTQEPPPPRCCILPIPHPVPLAPTRRCRVVPWMVQQPSWAGVRAQGLVGPSACPEKLSGLSLAVGCSQLCGLSGRLPHCLGPRMKVKASLFSLWPSLCCPRLVPPTSPDPGPGPSYCLSGQLLSWGEATPHPVPSLLGPRGSVWPGTQPVRGMAP